MFENYKNWTISSEAPNRRTFNDQWAMSVTHVRPQAIGGLKKIDYLKKKICIHFKSMLYFSKKHGGLKMIVEDATQNPQVIVPKRLYNLVHIVCTCELTHDELNEFYFALKCILNQMQIDGLYIDSLTPISALFVDSKSIRITIDDDHCVGCHMSWVIYFMHRARKLTKDQRVFMFIEEMVHHFWRIQNEEKAKLKTIETIQFYNPNITVEMVKGWNVNGF